MVHDAHHQLNTPVATPKWEWHRPFQLAHGESLPAPWSGNYIVCHCHRIRLHDPKLDHDMDHCCRVVLLVWHTLGEQAAREVDSQCQ